MYVDFRNLSKSQVYHAMVQTLVPRPVAWVLSDNGDGTLNLAPFSYFTGVASSPPLLALSVGHKPDGSKKDTWTNIELRDHFVVHIPSVQQVAAVTESAAHLAHGDSEVTRLGLPTTEIPAFRLPRLSDPPVAMACRRHQIIELGDGPQALIIGLIESMVVSDSSGRDEDGRLYVDPKVMDPLVRLGGDTYAHLGQVFTVAPRRPK